MLLFFKGNVSKMNYRLAYNVAADTPLSSSFYFFEESKHKCVPSLLQVPVASDEHQSCKALIEFMLTPGERETLCVKNQKS
mmetsp:Transcript_3303/g.3741  ORF Transcript_3303/g.3741 Transcript_3303/m.3741 type:complete len:81 (-) Transcript_3303:68-310(-)